MNLVDKKVLVVGAARSGIAAAKMAREKGARVTLTDARSAERTGLVSFAEDMALELGGHRESSFVGADLIVLSPGVPPTLPELAAARQRGVAITGEVELASHYIEAPIVAVTGTNGKSTVTTLCGEIARATGRPVFVGGNLGTPLSEAVGTEAATRPGIVVCEVSSFQLETCVRFHPRAAVLLNITPDHLDRYTTMSAYADAKLRILRQLGHGDIFVMNEDDPGAVEAYQRNVGGWRPIVTYSTRGRPHHRYSQATGDGVVEIDAGGFIDEKDAALVLRLVHLGGVVEERYPIADLQLVGRHNLGNALAAYLAMRGSNLASASEVQAGGKKFQPLPHRMELVGEFGGVRYYDDSKGTNVAAVVASIEGFPRPFILIAGGRDKGGSYAQLREALARNHARGVIVLGEAADKIASAVEGVAPVKHATSMEDAVAQAAGLAGDGDAVILSPACASFDMFRDYAHRGEVFREAVQQEGKR